MRHKVAFMTMALVAFAVGSARANDATQVVYDLSALRAPRSQAPAPSRAAEYRMPSSNLPLVTPSLSSRSNDGQTLYSGDDLEVRRPNHQSRVGTGVGSPRNPGNGGNGGPDPRQPAPTPEPGTMMLLGGALASGARFIRRRRND